MEQDPATRAKIAAYLAAEAATQEAGYPPTHAAYGLYPEIAWHGITGDRHLLSETVITAAAQALRLAILTSCSPSPQREHAMRHIVDGYLAALSALGMDSAMPH